MKSTTTITLDSELKKEAMEFFKKEGMKLSPILNGCLKKLMEEQKCKNKN